MSPSLSSPVHVASLVDASLHSPALLELLKVKISRTFVEYIVDCVVDTVEYAMGHASASNRGRTSFRSIELANFTTFVTSVIRKAEIKIPVLLVALVYIHRAKPHLQIAFEEWAYERVFLGAVIVANKYLNDSTLKNVHWALCTGVFGKRDIGRIEREFLDVLDFELGVHEADILAHHDIIMSLDAPHHVSFRTPPVRKHVRSHHSAHHSPAPALGPASRWSLDSSELDDRLSDSSAESLSPPHTPEHMDVDSASYVPAPPKDEQDAHAPVPLPLPSPDKDTKSQRMSSALHLLRSFPMPHFPSSISLLSHSSSSAASSTASSASSSSTSIPLTRFSACRSTASAFPPSHRTACA